MARRGNFAAREVRPARAEHRILPQPDDRAEDCREELAEHCRPCRARNAHMERDDEENVQPDVEQRREHKKDERRAAVAERTEHIGNDIIKNRRAGAEQYHKEIGIGVGEDVLRRLHPAEHRPGKQAHERREQQRKRRRERPRHRGAPAHAGLIPCAAALAQADAEAAGQPLHEAEDEIADDARGADGGERVRAERFADNDRVGKRIEKLEEIPAEHRQRIPQQHAERTAFRQLSFHAKNSFGFCADTILHAAKNEKRQNPQGCKAGLRRICTGKPVLHFSM